MFHNEMFKFSFPKAPDIGSAKAKWSGLKSRLKTSSQMYPQHIFGRINNDKKKAKRLRSEFKQRVDSARCARPRQEQGRF